MKIISEYNVQYKFVSNLPENSVKLSEGCSSKEERNEEQGNGNNILFHYEKIEIIHIYLGRWREFGFDSLSTASLELISLNFRSPASSLSCFFRPILKALTISISGCCFVSCPLRIGCCVLRFTPLDS